MACWVFFCPKNNPSSRCTAIGNHSLISSAKTGASSTKYRHGVTARTEFRYTCGIRSAR